MYTARHDKSRIINSFRELDSRDTIGKRCDVLAERFGAHPGSIRRILVAAGLIGAARDDRSAVSSSRTVQRDQQQVREAGRVTARLILAAAESVTSGQSELGRAIAGGLVLSEIISGQRASVARMRDEVARLSAIVAGLTAPALDGQPISSDEVHRAVASQARLVDAMLRLQDAERSQWGIKQDAGPQSYGSLLDRLAASEPPNAPQTIEHRCSISESDETPPDDPAG